MLGLSDGWLLAYEYPSLERIESKQIFWADEANGSDYSGSLSEREVNQEVASPISATAGHNPIVFETEEDQELSSDLEGDSDDSPGMEEPVSRSKIESHAIVSI